MTGTGVDFLADLTALDQFIDDMARFDAVTREQVAALDQRVTRLHSVWTGEAATAQHHAHAEVLQGVAQMHTALEHLRAAARTAHSNYGAAASTNVSMFAQLG